MFRALITRITVPFWNNRKGSVAVLTAIALAMLVFVVGAGVDWARANKADAVTMGALDAAALAAAKEMTRGTLSASRIEQLAKDHFNAAVAAQSAKGLRFNALTVEQDATQNTVKVSVQVELDTAFVRLAGFNQMTLNRAATAAFDSKDLELSLMLDVTGSMGGSKISELRRAARDVVDILMDGAGGGQRVRIGLVPYSASVNVGAGIAGQVSNGESADGCVIERAGSAAYDDTAPAAGSYISTYGSPGVSRNRRYACPSAQVLPMTDNKRQLKRAIDRLRAGGYTAGHLGAAWAWYMVSPKWAGVWPAASRPEAYGTPDLIKAVVLMSDGEFNTNYLNGRPNSNSRNQAERLCDAMKAENVMVFTVGFELRNAGAVAMLEDCATSPAQAYLASNGTELREAFASIAQYLARLRVKS